MKRLETERLILRNFEDKDYQDMLEYLSDERVQFPACGKAINDSEKAHKYFNKILDRDNVWAVELKDENKVIGSIGAYNLTYNDIAERHLGFVLNYSYWNNGYITEGCRAIIKFLFEEEKMDRIAMSNYEFNKNSIRVAEKLGFVKEGVLRKEDRLPNGELIDRIIYSIIKDEYFEVASI